MDPTEQQALYEAALRVATSQADRDEGGEGVGAAALVDDGSILTGVWVDAMVDSACLCAETGPIAEAHRTGRTLRASICVRVTPTSRPSVLAACGVCQERLAIFGSGTLIAVAHPEGPGFEFLTLAELRPSPWWESSSAASDESQPLS